MKKNKRTYGAELEIPDIDTRIKLPKGNIWDEKDQSVMNSNGTGNDPKSWFNLYGGEINVKPANSIEKLLEEIEKIYDVIGKDVKYNFTSDFHIHIHVDNLYYDLSTLKRIVIYLCQYGKQILELVEPFPILKRENFPTKKVFLQAKTQYKKRKIAHQTLFSKNLLGKLLKANTVDDFFDSFIPKSKENGRPLKFLMRRHFVNLFILTRKARTMEFRFFSMSKDLNKMYSALKFCDLLLDNAISWDLKPNEILNNNKDLQFQKLYPYNYELDKIFQLTNVRYNSRRVVQANYEKLYEEGVLKKYKE